MGISAHIGYAQGPYGQDVAAQAARQALDQAGRNPIVFGLIISSHHHSYQSILNGISPLLGDIPLLGFCTITEITSGGLSHHSVIVALFSGDSFTVQADFWPGVYENLSNTVQQLSDTFKLTSTEGTLLVMADGFAGDAGQLCEALPTGDYIVAGGLSGGSLQTATAYQIGGRQAGMGGLAAALLKGQLTVATGQSCGWQPVGRYVEVTGSSGCRIQALDHQRAVDTYAGIFNVPATDWVSPPLNELIHLYPLGIEQSGMSSLLVRSPLHVEKDGSFLMNTSIAQGSIAHLLIGSQDTCVKAAQAAARQALAGLDSARPFLGLIWVDAAWQMLLESQPGLEIKALREALGSELPLIGGYSYGQIHGAASGFRHPELYNQHLQLILFAQKSA
jgi:hypothetical protein